MRWRICLGLLSAVLFCGCSGSDSGSGSSSQSEVSSTEPAESGHTIAFVTNQIADFWYIAEAGCRDASKEFGIEVEVRMPPDATAVEQKDIVEDLITRGVDAIAISPLDADNQKDWINKIASSVKLITQDSDAPGTDRLMYIGMDNYKAGRMCGELVREALPDGGKVMLFIGRLEQDNAKLRRQGVIDELLGRERDAAFYASQPDAYDAVEGEVSANNYTVLGTLTDTGKQDIAQRKAEDALNTYPDINAMVGLFAYNPPACYEALKKAGKLGEVKLIGFDESDQTLQAIKEGNCIGTVVQNPYEYGFQSVRVLKSILEGDDSVIPESKFIDIPARKINKENVQEFWDDLLAKKGG